MRKHEDRLPVYDQTSPRWIATEAYKQALIAREDLRHKITGVQYGNGPPDEGSIVLHKDNDATVYFNESTNLVFVQLPIVGSPPDEEEYQVGPQAI